MKLHILEQENSPEAINILVKMIIRLCVEKGLTNNLTKILDDCDIKYKLEE